MPTESPTNQTKNHRETARDDQSQAKPLRQKKTRGSLAWKLSLQTC